MCASQQRKCRSALSTAVVTALAFAASAALRQTAGGWTYGALAHHLWSFAGDGDRADVNATFLQPFVSTALGRGRTVSANLESTYAWNGGEGGWCR